MSNKVLPKPKYILVCDDIREEKDTKKFILLGLYSGKLILRSIPTTLPRLAMRVCLDLSKPYFEDVEIKIRKPDKTIMGSFKASLKRDRDIKEEIHVNIILSPFPIEFQGEYELVLEHNKKETSILAFETELRSATS